MIEFCDENILSDITLEEGGACDFCDDSGYKRGYSLFIKSESSDEIFEVILSEEELKKMLKEVKDL